MICPRWWNSSSKLSSSFPSLTLVKYQPCDCFGRTSIHTLFVVLYTMSWGPAYVRHTSNSVWRAVTVWVQVTPYYLHDSVNLPRHFPHSTCCLEVTVQVNFIYIIQQWPCVIPFEQRNVIDNELPHLTINSCSPYQKINNFTICNGTFLSNSFFASVQWLTLSDAVFASRKHMYTGVSWLW